MKIKCGTCGESFQNTDAIFLDELNTVVHQSCYNLENNLLIKDVGTYKAIVARYDFSMNYLNNKKGNAAAFCWCSCSPALKGVTTILID
jgi:hypothetical protein